MVKWVLQVYVVIYFTLKTDVTSMWIVKNLILNYVLPFYLFKNTAFLLWIFCQIESLWELSLFCASNFLLSHLWHPHWFTLIGIIFNLLSYIWRMHHWLIWWNDGINPKGTSQSPLSIFAERQRNGYQCLSLKYGLLPADKAFLKCKFQGDVF